MEGRMVEAEDRILKVISVEMISKAVDHPRGGCRLANRYET